MKSLMTTTLMTIGLSTVASAALPFEAGESLQYNLRWRAFSVGTATLEANGLADVGNQSAYQVSFHVATNGFADRLYKVRDSYFGFVTSDFSQSFRFDRLEEHKNRARHTTIHIDQQGRKATYVRNEKEREPIDILHSSFDPVSIIFAARKFTLSEGTTFSLPVTDGKNAGLVKIVVKKGESVKTPAGTYDTVLVEPDLKAFAEEGKKTPSIKIWFSADADQLPVKIESDSELGRFSAQLASVGKEARDPVSISEIASWRK